MPIKPVVKINNIRDTYKELKRTSKEGEENDNNNIRDTYKELKLKRKI